MQSGFLAVNDTDLQPFVLGTLQNLIPMQTEEHFGGILSSCIRCGLRLGQYGGKLITRTDALVHKYVPSRMNVFEACNIIHFRVDDDPLMYGSNEIL